MDEITFTTLFVIGAITLISIIGYFMWKWYKSFK